MSAIFAFSNQHESMFRLILCSFSFFMVLYSNHLMNRNNSFETENAAWLWFFITTIGISITLGVFIHTDLNLIRIADLDLNPDSDFVMLIEMIAAIAIFCCNFIFLCIGLPQWEKLTEKQWLVR